MSLAFYLTLIEVKAYLRNKSAVFWTFAYPVFLLLILSIIFGNPSQQHYRIVLDADIGNAKVVEFENLMNDKLKMINGLNVELIYKEKTTVKPQDIVLTFDEDFADASKQTSVKIAIGQPLTEATGGLVALIAEVVEVYNRHLLQAEQLVKIDYRGIPVGSANPNDYDRFLISGLTALTVVSTAMFGFTTVLVDLRQNGSLKMFQVFPLQKIHFLSAFIMSRMMILFFFCISFYFAANMAYKTNIALSFDSIFALVLLLFVGILCFLSVGLLIVSSIKNGATATALLNIINLPLLFLSDLFIPVAVMPETVRFFAEMSPVYAFVNALRQVHSVDFTFSDASFALILMTCITLVCLTISAKYFKWSKA